MHPVNSVNRSDLKRKTAHIDASSAQALKDANQNANGYTHVAQFLGTISDTVSKRPSGLSVGSLIKSHKDYLGHFGPIHRIRDGSGKKYDLADYQDFVLACAEDKLGRKRDLVAYKGILNPINEVQFLLWWMSHQTPRLANAAIRKSMNFLEAQLRSTFGAVPIQLAYHVKTGRGHYEWTLPIYTRDKVKAAKGVKWDAKTITIAHIRGLTSPKFFPPPFAPRLNSEIEMNWSRWMGLNFKRLIVSGRLPLPKDKDCQQCANFLYELQLASLRDRCASRSPRTKKKAEKKMEDLRSKQEKADQAKKIAAAAAKHAKDELMLAQAVAERQQRVEEAAKRMTQHVADLAKQAGRTHG